MNRQRLTGYLPSWGFLLLAACGVSVCLLVLWVVSPPMVRSGIAKNDIFKSSLVRYVEIVNFGHLEGPYPLWQLPVVRWGMGPENRILFDCPESTEADVLLQTRSLYKRQRMKITVNGRVAHRLDLPPPPAKGAFEPVRFRVALKKGPNELVLEYSKWKQGQNDRRPMAVLFSGVEIEKEIAGSSRQVRAPLPTDIFRGAGVTFGPARGFRGLEGPYPKWRLPRVRWGLAPESRLVFESPLSRAATIRLRVRTVVAGQTMSLELNGRLLGRYPVQKDLPPGEFQEITVATAVDKGENALRITYSGSLQNVDSEKDPLAVLFAALTVD